MINAPAPAGPPAALGWPAMVLTAGLGTRLRPLSALRAKPALPVAGVPLAGRILRWLAAGGVSSAVLNLHHLPASVTAAVGDGCTFGMAVRYSWEPVLLGSAGGPARALPLLDAERFVLVNGDTLTDLDLAALAAQHLATGARVTMAVIANPDPARYGGVVVDAHGHVTGFPRPGAHNHGWHFIGVQAVDASVFAGLDPDQPSETVGHLYRDLIAREPGAVRAFVGDASFRDIGTAADYLETTLSLAAVDGCPDLLYGPRTVIEPGARVTRSVLWDDVWIGPDAVVDACVVTDGARVPAGAHFSHQVLVAGSTAAGRADVETTHGLLVSPIDAGRRRRLRGRN